RRGVQAPARARLAPAPPPARTAPDVLPLHHHHAAVPGRGGDARHPAHPALTAGWALGYAAAVAATARMIAVTAAETPLMLSGFSKTWSPARGPRRGTVTALWPRSTSRMRGIRARSG